jgi:hypothetical protein
MVKLAVVLVAGLALGLWAYLRDSRAALVIENRSKQPIAVIRVTVSEAIRFFEDVPPGGDVSVPLKARGEEQLSVEGKLADGTLIRGRWKKIPEGRRLVVGPGGSLAEPARGQKDREEFR